MLFGTVGNERLRIDSSGHLKVPDNAQLRFGGSQTGDGDMKFYHDGSNSFIQHLGTGGLYIDALNNSADIAFRSQDNINFYTNAASQSSIACVGNGGVILYNQGNARFNVDHDGAVVTEKRLAINRNAGDPYLNFQTSGTGSVSLYGGASTGFRVFTRPSGGSLTERLRVTNSGNVQLPVNGQQLTWGASQQMKFYYENSEDRMYLQGDGAYGFAFRINSGNRIEIDKTTGDVTMQGASGRNFLWDNSEPSLYLTDNGTNSARLKIGAGGDLQMYHDVSGNVNHITAATNGTIKISGGVEFFDYTGVTKRAVIDSNGLRIGTVASPTLPTTGKPPMIMRTETYFTKEVHRTISDYRQICDGTHLSLIHI